MIDDRATFQHIGILLLQIEQVSLVGTGGAIAAAIPHDHGAKAAAETIHRGGADAATSGTARNDQRINAVYRQPAREIGPKEGGRVALVELQLPGPWTQRLDDLRRRGIRCQRVEYGGLEVKKAPITAVGCIDVTREGDRYIRTSCGRQDSYGVFNSTLYIAATQNAGIRKSLREIDDDQRRRVTESK